MSNSESVTRLDGEVVTDALVNEIAQRTARAERSVYRRLLGLEVRGQAGIAIDRALAEIGITTPAVIRRSE